jgi:hypothetical protein
MDINLTFCVQVINFIVFYYCVSRFFLKPFVNFIQAKAVSRSNMLEGFANKEEHLKALINARSEHAVQFKKVVKDKYELPAVAVTDAPPDQPVGPAVPAEQKALVQDLVHKLVTRIKDAY